MNYIFNIDDIKRMIEHWIATPPNGYIGLSYARNPKELLFKPLDQDSSDTFLSWMREDIPILKQLSDNDLSIVEEVHSFESKTFHVSIGRILLPIQIVNGDTVEGV